MNQRLLEISIMINDEDLKTWHRCYKAAQESSIREWAPLYSSCSERQSRAAETWRREGSRWLPGFMSGEIISYHLKMLQKLSKIFHFNVLLRVQNAYYTDQSSRSHGVEAAAQMQSSVFWAREEHRFVQTQAQLLCILQCNLMWNNSEKKMPMPFGRQSQ